MPIKKALVPVDGSEVSMKAVKLAAKFASKHGWDVVLLHILERPPMPSFAFPDGVKTETLRELDEAGWTILRQAEEIFKTAGVSATCKVIDGPAAETILSEVEEGCCEILIIGSTGLGRGKIGSFVLGSVAEQVIRKVKVPILLVKEDTVID